MLVVPDGDVAGLWPPVLVCGVGSLSAGAVLFGCCGGVLLIGSLCFSLLSLHALKRTTVERARIRRFMDVSCMVWL